MWAAGWAAGRVGGLICMRSGFLADLPPRAGWKSRGSTRGVRVGGWLTARPASDRHQHCHADSRASPKKPFRRLMTVWSSWRRGRPRPSAVFGAAWGRWRGRSPARWAQGNEAACAAGLGTTGQQSRPRSPAPPRRMSCSRCIRGVCAPGSPAGWPLGRGFVSALEGHFDNWLSSHGGAGVVPVHVQGDLHFSSKPCGWTGR
jgi:hypothetical protein